MDMEGNRSKIKLMIKTKDYKFYEQLFVLYADELFLYGCQLGLSKEDVDDQIHDLFLSFMLKKTDMKSIENLRSYVFRSFHNKVMDFFRENEKSIIQVGTFEAVELEDLEKYSTAKRLETAINKSIGELTLPQRTALTLRYFQDFSYDDIAQIIGCTPHAARKFVSKALASLRKKSNEFKYILDK